MFNVLFNEFVLDMKKYNEKKIGIKEANKSLKRFQSRRNSMQQNMLQDAVSNYNNKYLIYEITHDKMNLINELDPDLSSI